MASTDAVQRENEKPEKKRPRRKSGLLRCFRKLSHDSRADPKSKRDSNSAPVSQKNEKGSVKSTTEIQKPAVEVQADTRQLRADGTLQCPSVIGIMSPASEYDSFNDDHRREMSSPDDDRLARPAGDTGSPPESETTDGSNVTEFEPI